MDLYLTIMLVMTMVFRKALNLRPINSVKHVVDIQQGLVAGTQFDTSLIETADNPVLANTNDVATASVVKWIFLNVQVSATTSGALSNCYMIVWKNPGSNLALITANTVGTSDEMKQVIHQEMTMTERSTAGNPRVLFKGVIRIPKKYQRFGHDDALTIGILSPGTNQDLCIQCIYKEFR